MTTMLFRPADAPNPEVWDLCVEYTIVEDEHLEAHLADGWVRRPLDLFPPETDADPNAPNAPKRRGRPPKEG